VHRRSLAALVLVVLASGALAVGVADPGATAPDRTPVAVDAPPAAAVESALRQAETGDYRVRVSLRDRNGSERDRLVAHVSHATREVRVRSADGRPPFLTYANAHVGWRGRPGDLERGAGTADAHDTPFRDVEVSAAELVTASADAVTYRVRDDATALRAVGYDPDYGGNATLTVVVNRTSGTLSRVVFERRVVDDGVSYWGTVWRFSRWGAVDVRRPPGAGYSLAEFLSDAVS
jgi:hypothetical protein